jgi:type I restriction enzyme R subunit
MMCRAEYQQVFWGFRITAVLINVMNIVRSQSYLALREFALFKQKAKSFLRDHSDLPVVYKLRMNIQLDEGDIKELHSALLDIGGDEVIAKVSDESEGLGLFARSLVGLDRKAASDALSDFTAGNTFSAKQITFVEMVVAQLTEHGIADRKSFYDPPFTDVAPAGPSGLFDQSKLAELDQLLADVIGTATPR